MGIYHLAQICKNGHVINTCADIHPERNQKYCEKCGALTITHCENCGAPIRGYYEVPGVMIALPTYARPSFCHNCGRPYPWTRSALQAAKELVATFDRLNEEERQELERSLDDIIRETPRSKIAELNFRRIMKKVDSEGCKLMREVIVNVISEAARRSLFGS